MLLLLPASAVRASPYWIAYEGNDFPENEGWLRWTGGGGGQRSIEDGWFVLDTRASLGIYDYYEKRLGGALDPGPGETFVMQWRLLVGELQGRKDPVAGVFSDEKWAVGFEYASDALWSVFEPGVNYPFEPGIPHTYELRSDDMRTDRLYVDDLLALEGSFWLSLTSPRVGWGDGIKGAASLSQWDYVRFGVVPEPATVITDVCGLVWIFRRGSRPARDETN
ncbi:MAG: hypothetical protein AB1601_07360 [Planctomycetota bacterium]